MENAEHNKSAQTADTETAGKLLQCVKQTEDIGHRIDNEDYPPSKTEQLVVNGAPTFSMRLTDESTGQRSYQVAFNGKEYIDDFDSGSESIMSRTSDKSRLEFVANGSAEFKQVQNAITQLNKSLDTLPKCEVK